MKPSKFNIFIPLQESEEFLIFNTLTDSRVVVNRHIKEVIEKSPINEFLLGRDERGYLKELLELGIVVTDNVDEDLELEYWFQRFKFDTSILGITVLPTYACNLACTYCYENGIRMTPSLNDDISRRMVLWIIRRLESVRPNTLRLLFFGGEPLLNIRPIKMISEELFYSCKKRRVDLEIRLVTNGVLLSGDIVDYLNQFGLKGIKVTLDGDQGAHDSKRRYRDGRGTFDAILENLKRIKGKVPITIGGNFDDSIKHSIPALLDRLKESGFTSDDIEMIRFKPILYSIGNGCTENKVCTFSSINSEDFLWLKEEIEKRGFNTSQDVSLGPCEAVREHNYVIDPIGKIYKCAGFVGREEFIIGDINSDSGLLHTNTQFMTADLWRKCKGCPYIPICGGGCRVNSNALWGNFLNSACEAEYLNKVSLEMVKDELVIARSDSEEAI